MIYLVQERDSIILAAEVVISFSEQILKIQNLKNNLNELQSLKI